ncbi:golgi phosphoprotein 3 [Nematocida sp. LUAm3]|nr:golgi phosphoprotein 3 [Nematocida sp. LUAm3]KAI5175344.1 golgi phosphoprotein 3 [Nematocida sp. LUAm2]KAI5177699.1 golgi phosphoprotein 3 [Nematocida sp. LUAm1]
MDEEFTLRRREVIEETAFQKIEKLKSNLTLSEALVLFSSNTQNQIFPIMQDPISMSIRVLIVCELILQNRFIVSSQKLLVAQDVYMPIDPLHDEAYKKIKGAKKSRDIQKWLFLLNGETYSIQKDKYHLKNARARVAELLVVKKIFKKPKSKKKQLLSLLTLKSFNGVEELSQKGSKADMIHIISSFLLGKKNYHEDDVYRLSILICALSYCCLIEDVLLTLSPSDSEHAQKKTMEIVNKYKSELGTPANSKEWSILCTMRGYLKLGTWM